MAPKEQSRRYRDPAIESIIPEGYSLWFVRKSRGSLSLEPSQWSKYYDEFYDPDRYALEVRAKNNRVMAAVGWYRTAGDRRKRALTTFGTYVSVSLRKRGLAQKLWKAMARITRVKTIHSTPITDEGITLVKSMTRIFKNVQVKFYEDPELTDLRGAA